MARTMAVANAPSGTTISGPISINPLGASAVCRYRELYLCSLAQRARRVNRSVVRPYRLTRDRQSESGAARLVGDVRLPYGREILRGDSLAVIGHRDTHCIAPTEPRDIDFHADTAVLSGSIDGIQQHVAQRAGKRSVVTVHTRKILVYLEIQSNAWRHAAARCVTNELSHVDFRRRTLGQSPELGETPRHAIETRRLHLDDVDIFLQRRGSLVAQAGKREPYGRERILDLVRHSSRAFPECVEPVSYTNLTLTVLELRHHLTHAASERLEFGRAAHPARSDLNGRPPSGAAVLSRSARYDRALGRRRKRLTVSNDLRPSHQLVERAAQLPAEMSRHA